MISDKSIKDITYVFLYFYSTPSFYYTYHLKNSYHVCLFINTSAFQYIILAKDGPCIKNPQTKVVLCTYLVVFQINSERTCTYSAKAVWIFLNRAFSRFAALFGVLFSIDILDLFQL